MDMRLVLAPQDGEQQAGELVAVGEEGKMYIFGQIGVSPGIHDGLTVGKTAGNVHIAAHQFYLLQNIRLDEVADSQSVVNRCAVQPFHGLQVAVGIMLLIGKEESLARIESAIALFKENL